MLHAHVTVQSQSSKTVVNKDGSTTTTTVVTRAYIDGDQHPGQFIKATTETLTTRTPGGNSSPNSDPWHPGQTTWDPVTTRSGEQSITYGHDLPPIFVHVRIRQLSATPSR